MYHPQSARAVCDVLLCAILEALGRCPCVALEESCLRPYVALEVPGRREHVVLKELTVSTFAMISRCTYITQIRSSLPFAASFHHGDGFVEIFVSCAEVLFI